ncbi:MAG: hypothetical protein HUU46_10990 [Candidatus Hydrogenedentes bacterium]|nr:hypothetical protein [Candidatus Hydrogenedentota bacterium]
MAKKEFDCVEMKARIQERMQKEYEGLSDSEVRERIRRRLETSNSLIAQKWRRMRDIKTAEIPSAEHGSQ